MHKFRIHSLYLDNLNAANIALINTLRILSTTLNIISFRQFTELGLFWFIPSQNSELVYVHFYL